MQYKQIENYHVENATKDFNLGVTISYFMFSPPTNFFQRDPNSISTCKLLEGGNEPKRMEHHHCHLKNSPKKFNTSSNGTLNQGT